MTQQTIPSPFLDGYICWPFTSKGHFHLPSGIAPVFADIQARYHKEVNPKKPFLFLSHSWNINGKPVNDDALCQILGVSREELYEDEEYYASLLKRHLKKILVIAAERVNQNINRSKDLMAPLRLMQSGLYSCGEYIPYEFRDDDPEYALFLQQRFIEWFERGIAYLSFEEGKPQFFLNIHKLYVERPLNLLLERIETSKSVIKQFKNNYINYNKDLPISTIGAFGTPVPLYVDNHGNVHIPILGSESIDPRLDSENANYMLIIKPLIGCYLFIDYLADKFSGFDNVFISNDYHMATRVNYVSLLLDNKSYNTLHMRLFNLLRAPNGSVYSFKRGVVQSINELDLKLQGLARFTILKSTRLGCSSIRVNIDQATLKKVHTILKENNSVLNEDIISSNFYKKNISVSEMIEKGIQQGDNTLVLNFLLDALMHNPTNSLVRYYLSLFL